MFYKYIEMRVTVILQYYKFPTAPVYRKYNFDNPYFYNYTSFNKSTMCYNFLFNYIVYYLKSMFLLYITVESRLTVSFYFS